MDGRVIHKASGRFVDMTAEEIFKYRERVRKTKPKYFAKMKARKRRGN